MKSFFSKTAILVIASFAVVSMLYSNFFWNRKTKEESNIGAFTSIVVKGEGTLHLSQGSSEHVDVPGAKVESGVLTIDLKGDGNVRVGKFNALSVSGNVHVRNQERFSIEDFTLTVNDQGNVFLALRGDFLNVSISGSGRALLSGIVEEEHVIIEGESKYQAAALLAQKASITAKGAAQVWVNIARELTVTASGTSIVRYGGAPANVSKNVTDSAQVEPLG